MSVPELLLAALDDLRNDDIRRFQFFLNMKMVDGCDPIPKRCLEDSSRDGIVSEMINRYGEKSAVNVTNVILEKMGFNTIRLNLMEAYEEGQSSAPASTSTSSSSSSSSSSSAPAPPSAPITMSAQQGSVVIAPTLTSGTIGTLNISINKP